MDDPKTQVISYLKDADHILVTVSNNPTVDQLSAAIGLTLFLNKLNKHCTAVFSGAVPSTLEFLNPERTLEKNTDSLRDFIISLDKSKADKLRYKVEDEHVKIFITPYRTSISERDLNFEQGDFNVEVVLALGVKEQQELDAAISAHGRILHDATVISVSTQEGSQLGSVNWTLRDSSSLSEMAYQLTAQLKAEALDGQIATAFLTGIVSETARFSNDKTTSDTMSVSAKLMASGANQQLIATELEKSLEPEPEPEPESEPEIKLDNSPILDGIEEQWNDYTQGDDIVSEDGTLKIGHYDDPAENSELDTPMELPQVSQVEDTQFEAQEAAPTPNLNQVEENDENELLRQAKERLAKEQVTQGHYHRLISKPNVDAGSAPVTDVDASSEPVNPDASDVNNSPVSQDDTTPVTLTHEQAVVDVPAAGRPGGYPHEGARSKENVASNQPVLSSTDQLASSERSMPPQEPKLQEQQDTLADLERAVGSPHSLGAEESAPEGLMSIDDEPAQQAQVSQQPVSAQPQAQPTVMPQADAAAQLPQFDLSQLERPAPQQAAPAAPPSTPPPMQGFVQPAAPQAAAVVQPGASAQPQRSNYANPFDLPPI